MAPDNSQSYSHPVGGFFLLIAGCLASLAENVQPVLSVARVVVKVDGGPHIYGPELVEELYPDQETFKKEEQRRFALLDEHMDIPIRMDKLSDWSTTAE